MWFGPIATTKNLRTGGIHTVMLLKCLQSMKEIGYRIPETDGIGSLYFHSKMVDAIMSQIFWRLQKE